MNATTNVQSRTLRIRQFSIGPNHDPYGASEFIYEHNGNTTVLYRDGLFNIRVLHNDSIVFHGYCCPQDGYIGSQQEQAENIFAELTGLTYNQFNRAYEKLNPTGFEDPMGNLSDYM